MEPKGSFPHSQARATCPSPESTIHATCPAHLILLYFITQIILGEEYRSEAVWNILYEELLAPSPTPKPVIRPSRLSATAWHPYFVNKGQPTAYQIGR